MKASEAQIQRALDRPDGQVKLFLLFGADDASSRALASRLGQALGETAERVDLEGARLKEDVSLLRDEAAARSLFGDRRWLRVTGGDECLAAVEGLLQTDSETEPVALIAGALKPSSALLKLALGHPAVLAYQSYKLEGGRAAVQVVAIGRTVGLRIDAELARVVAEAGAGDRAVIECECEKFALYLDAAPDRPRELTRDVFDLLSADASEASSFAAVDAIFDGRPDVLAKELGEMAEGASAIPLLRLAARRALLLAGGASYLKGREGEAVGRQQAKWPAERLAAVSSRLFAAEEAIKAGGAGDLPAHAQLLAIARLAQRLR